jgi:putative transposase
MIKDVVLFGRHQTHVIGILQEHEAGAKCADPCRKHGMSESTFHTWNPRRQA